MVNRIDIEVSARGNFSQLNAQIAELKAAVAELQSKPLLGDTGKATAAQIAQVQTQFDKMLLSSRAFNVETVKMSNSIDKFGERLQAGQLHFSDYARLYRQNMKGMRTELDSLAESQARLAKSVVIPDALRTGYARVITNLTSDIKSLNAETEMTAIKTRELNTVINGMGTSLVNMGKNTQWAGRQLTVGLTVPMAAFGAMAAKTFKDVNTEITKLQRLYGKGVIAPTDEAVQKISDQTIALSQNIAQNMGIAQKETVKVAANFAAIGLQGNKLLGATEQAMKLSKLGALTSEDAQRTVVAIQNVFKVTSSDLPNAVNFLASIQKQTSLSLQDISDAIPRVGPIIQQLGGTYKDAAVMMVAMKEAGVPAAQSANAIKSAVASMIAPTTSASKMFQEFGISLSSIKDKTGGNPIQMIEALQQSMAKLSPLVKEQLIEKLFGKFQFARVTALIENLGRAGSQTKTAFEVAGATAGQLSALTSQEMKKATESTTGKWQRALESFKATLLPLGEKFMKFGTTVLNVFSKIMHFLDKFKPLENLLINILGGAAIIGPILMLVGLFGNLAGNIIKGFNYFRMFGQGLKDGGIVGGVKNIANFFEMINVETLASSKNMDQFTTSTEKTVEAFQLLNNQIGVMTRSLTEIYSRNNRMPIIISPLREQTLEQLQYANPIYDKNAGATIGTERPHMFPAARTWGGWLSNEDNIQGSNPQLNAFLANKAMFPTVKDQENWMRKGTSEQWGMPVPSSGLAAQLQKEYGKEDVVYGSKFGVTKEDVYARGFEKIQVIRNKILTGDIEADSKVAIELEKIAALPPEEQTKQLESVISKVTFTEEQYFKNLIESLVQQEALLKAPDEMLKSLDLQVKAIMSDPNIENRPAEVAKVLQQFNSDFLLLGDTVVSDINQYRTVITEAIMNANSAFEAAISAVGFKAGIVSQAELAGGIKAEALGKFASMDKHPLEQALIYTREVPKGFQTGGTIHAQDGVWVPGSGSGDRVPAMLEPGEFVVNRNAAKQYGGLLEHLNWNVAPRFGTGGETGLESLGVKGYMNAGKVENGPTYIARNLDKALGKEFMRLSGVKSVVSWWAQNEGVSAETSHSVLGNAEMLKMLGLGNRVYSIFQPGGSYLGPKDLNQFFGFFTGELKDTADSTKEEKIGIKNKILDSFRKSADPTDYDTIQQIIDRGAQSLTYEEAISSLKFLKHADQMGLPINRFGPINPKIGASFLEMLIKDGEKSYNNKIATLTAGADLAKSFSERNAKELIESGKSLTDFLEPGITSKDAVKHYQTLQDEISRVIPNASKENLFNLLAHSENIIGNISKSGKISPKTNFLEKLLKKPNSETGIIEDLRPTSFTNSFMQNISQRSRAAQILEQNQFERMIASAMFEHGFQKGGGIPGYDTGVTPVPGINRNLKTEEQTQLLADYIKQTFKTSDTFKGLRSDFLSAATPEDLRLIMSGNGAYSLLRNPKLADMLQKYTLTSKESFLYPGMMPSTKYFDILNTLGPQERFLLRMAQSSMGSFQPEVMVSTSEKSPLLPLSLAQAIKAQGKEIGSIGIVPEDLSLSPYSEKILINMMRRGLVTEASAGVIEGYKEPYETNDWNYSDSKFITENSLSSFLKQLAANNSTVPSYSSWGTSARLSHSDVIPRMAESEARLTLTDWLRSNILAKQKGGGIPGFTEGYTDYLGQKLTGPLGYAVQSGITGTYNLETSEGPQTAYLKQMFEPGVFDYGEAPVNKKEMVMEAFLNQLQRGLGGSEAAVDQVFSRLVDPSGEGALKETSVLRSKFLEGFKTFRESGLSTSVFTGEFKGKIDPKQTLERYMESLLIGNEDLHDENFGYSGKTPTIIDSGITAIHDLIRNHKDNLIPESVRIGSMHDLSKVAKVSKDLLKEQGINIEDFSKGYTETLRSKISEELIHNALLRATGGVPELMTIFDDITHRIYGSKFVPAITKVLHARLDNMSMYTDPTDAFTRKLSSYESKPALASEPMLELWGGPKIQNGGVLRAQRGINTAWVPGSGDGDKVPALLEPGEFVINKKAASQYGGLLQDINFNKAPRFAAGGGSGLSRAEMYPYFREARIQGMNPQTAIAAARSASDINVQAQREISAMQKESLTATTSRQIEIQDMISAKQKVSAEAQAEILQTSAFRVSAIEEEAARAHAQMLMDAQATVSTGGSSGGRFFNKMFNSKGFKGGMTTMMGGQMLGMVGMQLAGKMQEGGAKDAVNYASMGAMMGGMFGPAGIAIGAGAGAALGFVTNAIQKESEKIKNEASAYNESLTLGSTSLNNLGLKIKDFSNISFLAATKMGTSVSEIDRFAQAYANAQDEQTKNTLAYIKSLVDANNSAKLASFAQQKYNTAIAAGASPAKAMADIAGEFKQGGVGGYLSQQILSTIVKTKNPIQAFSKNLTAQITGVDFGKNVIDPTGYVKTKGMADYFKNIGSSWGDALKNEFDVNKLFTDPLKYANNFIPSIRQFGASFAGRKNIKYSDQALERIAKQESTLFQINPDKMIAAQNVLSKSKKASDQFTYSLINSRKGFNAFNAEFTKLNPKIGQYNTELSKTGANTQRLYNLTAMVSNGLQLDKKGYNEAANSLNAYNIALARYHAMQALAIGDNKMNAIAVKRQSEYDNSALSGGSSGGSSGKSNKIQKEINSLESLNKSRQRQIDAINKEMSDRQKEYDQQQKIIDQQKTLADLKNSAARAGASGDLIAMAEAQSNYNIELAKQQRLNEKDRADAADQKRIDAINAAMQATQDQIDKLQNKLNSFGSAVANAFKPQPLKDFTGAMSTMEEEIKNLAQSGLYKDIPSLMKASLADPTLRELIKKGLLKTSDIAKYLGIDKDKLQKSLTEAFNAMTQKGIPISGFKLKLISDKTKGMASGGIARYAIGSVGAITGPGGPKSDLIPAMLSNGEYVIQASSVGKYGIPMMDSINAGTYMPKYATGGIMKSYNIGSSSKEHSVVNSPQYNVNVVVNGANANADELANKIAMMTRREMESMGSGRGFNV